jgi:hypothetical protein
VHTNTNQKRRTFLNAFLRVFYDFFTLSHGSTARLLYQKVQFYVCLAFSVALSWFRCPRSPQQHNFSPKFCVSFVLVFRSLSFFIAFSPRSESSEQNKNFSCVYTRAKPVSVWKSIALRVLDEHVECGCRVRRRLSDSFETARSECC